MRPWRSQVVEDVGVVATGFFECVGKDGETGWVQFTRGPGVLGAGGKSEQQGGGRDPNGSERHRPSLEHTSDEVTMSSDVRPPYCTSPHKKYEGICTPSRGYGQFQTA